MKRSPLILATVGLLAALGGGVEAAERQLCVKVARANLRAGPGTEHRITWEVNRYMPFIQVEEKGDWFKVKDVDGDTHWIFKGLVAPNLRCLTIRSRRANIRKKPTTRSDSWFTVEKYTSFKRVGAKNNWVKIEYEGQTMWVYRTLVWPPPS